MSFLNRYVTTTPRGGSEPNVAKMVQDAVVVLALLIAFFIFNPVNSVPTGSRGVITRFGKITQIAPEGMVLLYPWERLALFSIRSEKADIEDAAGSTADTQPVTVSLTVRYAIATDRVADVYEKYSHDGDLSSYIQTATQETFKAVTAKYTAPDLIGKRALVSADINNALRAKVAIYGANIINIDMRNFSFSKSYMDAINEKVTQEQLRLGAENKLLTVESEQKQKVAVAQADASAVKATADGNAYATLKNAQAQADATKLLGQSIVANPQVLELRRIEVDMAKAKGWDGKLPQTIMGGSGVVPFMDVSKQIKGE
jgi:regulator of protease activity HflC (stomatin/prohibitin superfamily)